MKKQIILLACMLAAFITSCNKDNFIENEQKQYFVSADIKNDNLTKLSYQDLGPDNGMKVSWSDNEEFKVYCVSAAESDWEVLTYKKTGDGNVFSSNTPIPDRRKYIAYGDYDDEYFNLVKGLITIDFSSQVGTAEEGCIKTFMLADTTKMQEKIEFENQLVLLKIKLKLPETSTATLISNVEISGFYNKYGFYLTQNLKKNSYECQPGSIIATNNNHGFPVSSKEATVYISVFPQYVNAETVKIDVTAVDLPNVTKEEYSYTIKNARDLNADKGKIVPINAALEVTD